MRLSLVELSGAIIDMRSSGSFRTRPLYLDITFKILIGLKQLRVNLLFDAACLVKNLNKKNNNRTKEFFKKPNLM